MNKTVTINLASFLFHIDEDAFQKLQEYLNVLKRAYGNEQGSDEIISDIEARIAEIFNESKFHEHQVIDLKNVESAIQVMGQPEDLFEEDEPNHINKENNNNTNTESTTQKKQLFRDADQAYISGVSSGLSHYLQISAIWIRLAWVLLVFFSGGTFVLLYLSLWFFVPVAKTTAEKLAMKGKSVNVSTIEAKIKEGLNSVADTMKSAYHKTNGQEIKNKSAIVVSKLERFIGQFFKIFGRLLGICLMLISGIGIVTLFATFLGFNIINFSDNYWFGLSNFHQFGSSLWISSIVIFLTGAIPLFFIFILGLKISFPNVKKVGRTVILSLIGAWLLALIIFSISQFLSKKRNAVTASTSNKENLNLKKTDTLKLIMQKKDRYIDQFKSEDDFLVRKTMDGQKVLIYRDVTIYVKNETTKAPFIEIKKSAKGPNYNEALNLAEKMEFNYLFKNKTLFLDGYSLSDYEDKYRGQKVKIFLTLPEGITLFADSSTKSYNNQKKPNDFIIIKNKENHYLKLQKGKSICNDCYKNTNYKTINIDFDEDSFDEELENKIKKIIKESFNIEENKLKYNGKNFNININENGIEIKTLEEVN